MLVDMDGTLLDSEKVWDVALDDLAGWLGGRLSRAARVAMIGSNLTRSIGVVHRDLGLNADPATSAAYLLDRAEALFRTDLVWKPGARELLTDVRAAGVPTALVTSTVRRLTDIALDTMGRELFTVSVCGDEVDRPKPEPDPYLRGAQLLGVPAAACVAVEDSPTGIASAEAAGCAVIAVPSETAVHPAAGIWVRDTLVGLTVAELVAFSRTSRAAAGTVEACHRTPDSGP
ncbi:HAD family hydrolase [uncultured Jatrophihabitans sp.]|uniref:HAD family hydrolase n=1 Tax=uncultured Jatrophihabitans sp. TaxID=1610747 RepID=UPI0035CB474D